MAMRRVQASAMLEPDAVAKAMHKNVRESFFVGSFSADMFSICGNWTWLTYRQRADLVASPVSSWLEQEQSSGQFV